MNLHLIWPQKGAKGTKIKKFIDNRSGNSLRSHPDLHNDENLGISDTIGDPDSVLWNHRAAGVHHHRASSSDTIFQKPRRSGCAAGVTWRLWNYKVSFSIRLAALPRRVNFSGQRRCWRLSASVPFLCNFTTVKESQPFSSAEWRGL